MTGASDPRRHPRSIKPSDTNGDTLQTIDGVAAWGPPAGSTGVQAIPELLMADGVTSPPVPIENEVGDDWLYQD